MDESFFLRAKRLLDRGGGTPTFQALLDHIEAQRTASPTVQACAQAPHLTATSDDCDALAALILGEPGWRAAGQVQRGCFNRAVAARGVNNV